MTKQSEQQLWSQFRQRQEDAGAEKSLFNVLKLKDKVAVLNNYIIMMMMRVRIDTLVLDDDDDDEDAGAEKSLFNVLTKR